MKKIKKKTWAMLLGFINEECITGLTIALIASAVVSTIGTAYGVVSSVNTGRNAAKASKDNAEYNAQLAANQEEQEKLNRRENAKKEKDSNRRRRAAMEAAYSKSGVLLDGTPSDFINEQIETDALNVEQGNQEARQRGLGLQVSAQNSLIRGKNQSNAFRNKATSDLVGGVGGVVGGVASAKNASTGKSWWS